MQTRLNIKNFRVFDENGATFDINPITILTGPNSSGKSTLNKAILLLQDFWGQLKTDYDEGRSIKLGRYKLDFHKQPHSILGNFENVLHRSGSQEKEQSGNDNRVVVEVQVESYFLVQEVILHLEFGMLDSDKLKNGYLMAYSVKTLEGETIYSNERGQSASMDFSSVKQKFLYFLHNQHILANWEQENLNCQQEQCDVDEELKSVYVNIRDDKASENFVYPLVWQILHAKQEWRDGYRGHASSLLEEAFKNKRQPMDWSFNLNSPALNVFCYFPCLEALKDVEKNTIRSRLNEAIKSKGLDMTKPATLVFHKRDINKYSFRYDLQDTKENTLNLFLDEFEASNANSLHEFISELENEFFFVKNDILTIGSSDEFVFPRFAPDFDNSRYVEFWPKALLALNIISEIMACDQKYIEPEYTETGPFVFKYFMEDHINAWAKMIIEEIFMNLFPGELSYAKATLIQPRRVYPLDEDSDFAVSIKNLFEAKRKWELKDGADRQTIVENRFSGVAQYQTDDFTNSWLQHFGIAHHLEIKIETEGQSAIFKLHHGEFGERATSLADEGLGVLQLISILIKLETAILESQLNDMRNPTDLKDFPHSKYCPCTIIVEEPEIHLHPKYQSRLADLFLEAYEKYNIHFIIETHSEYLVRKAQVLVAEKNYESEEVMSNKNPFRVYYLPRDHKPYEMRFTTSGRFVDKFGTGFFDTASELAFELF